MTSMSNGNDAPVAPNAHRLLWAGFMAIVASGVGFAVRSGSVLNEWSKEFGFTQTELGQITGGGLTGFGIIIILSSFIAESIGYGRLLILAFLTHMLSAVITLMAPMAYASGGKDMCFQCLFWGMFLFSVGNGICEAVVNPLVATLFPRNKTHYLNILHAGWPAGLIAGGVASIFMNTEEKALVSWQIQISLFLIPVVLYGLMLLGQKMPKTEASASGVSLGQMLLQFAAPLLLVLLLIQALVGYVELGTDSWIAKITGAILDKNTGRWLFVYTSGLMFILRFTAGPIVHRTSPLGLLFCGACLACFGLYTLGGVESTMAAIAALTIYGLGKTFFWPTMLAVVSEQFPRGGAVTIGTVGGIGMLSAGLLGGPGIGFNQDYYASHQLQEASSATYERYKAPNENEFLGLKVQGLDGQKVSTLEDGGKKLEQDLAILRESSTPNEKVKEQLEKQETWWQDASKFKAEDEQPVKSAALHGGRMALKMTAMVPATMAVLYLLLILYFKAARGGYKPVLLEHQEPAAPGADF
jgi:MFS family permease